MNFHRRYLNWLPNWHLKNKKVLLYFKAPLSFMTYRMSLISAGSISLDSTYKKQFFWDSFLSRTALP
jgi:hypothetical protein